MAYFRFAAPSFLAMRVDHGYPLNYSGMIRRITFTIDLQQSD